MNAAAALALGTSLAYGVSNFIGPRLARDAPLYVLLITGQVCSLILAGLVVSVSGDGLPGGEAVAFAVLAGIGNSGGLVLLYRAAEVGPLSIVIPVGALGAGVPVVVGIGSGEPFGVAEAIGIGLALGGTVLVARRVGEEAEPHHDRRRAIMLAVASALCFGLFLAAMRPASDDGAGWAVVVSRLSLLAVLLAVGARTGALQRVALGRLPRLAVPGLLLFAGTIMYAQATQEGDLSIVSVLGSLFPVVTVALAVGIGQERLSRVQATGVVLTLAGVVALSLR